MLAKITTLTLLLATVVLNAAERPNVVIIYGDDVGYGDVGAYGATKIPTPFIDKIASEGLRFTDGHCTRSDERRVGKECRSRWSQER